MAENLKTFIDLYPFMKNNWTLPSNDWRNLVNIVYVKLHMAFVPRCMYLRLQGQKLGQQRRVKTSNANE
ncbi:hypothetical protein SUGI_0972270 [Cryptomeria japonica]|nr:hypothetical protein SUGI_0972270 [Cryptomeria japonica]